MKEMFRSNIEGMGKGAIVKASVNGFEARVTDIVFAASPNDVFRQGNYGAGRGSMETLLMAVASTSQEGARAIVANMLDSSSKVFSVSVSDNPMYEGEDAAETKDRLLYAKRIEKKGWKTIGRPVRLPSGGWHHGAWNEAVCGYKQAEGMSDDETEESMKKGEFYMLSLSDDFSEQANLYCETVLSDKSPTPFMDDWRDDIWRAALCAGKIAPLAVYGQSVKAAFSVKYDIEGSVLPTIQDLWHIGDLARVDSNGKAVPKRRALNLDDLRDKIRNEFGFLFPVRRTAVANPLDDGGWSDNAAAVMGMAVCDQFPTSSGFMQRVQSCFDGNRADAYQSMDKSMSLAVQDAATFMDDETLKSQFIREKPLNHTLRTWLRARMCDALELYVDGVKSGEISPC